MNVRFHPAARRELLDARAWYEERSPVSAAAFVHEIAACFTKIADAPYRYPAAANRARRLILPRFPFSIYYRTDADGITVVAVAHHKRRPGYWRPR